MSIYISGYGGGNNYSGGNGYGGFNRRWWAVLVFIFLRYLIVELNGFILLDLGTSFYAGIWLHFNFSGIIYLFTWLFFFVCHFVILKSCINGKCTEVSYDISK